MNPIKNDVPVQEFTILNKQIFIVRDDLCSPFPGNNNSKSRGIYQFLKKIDNDTIGVLDTCFSRGGWGVAWLGSILRKKVYVYVKQKCVNDFFRKMAKLHGGTIISLNNVGRINYNYNIAKKDIINKNGVMLPLYLKLHETVDEIEKVSFNILSKYDIKTIVVSVGSGTIASGIVRSADISKVKIYGIGHKDLSLKNRYNYIEKMSRKKKGITIIKMNYTYGQPNYDIRPPFPCDLYYDRWAWAWLIENINKLNEPILFWNIGGEWHHETGLFPAFRGDGITSKEEVDKWIENRGLI